MSVKVTNNAYGVLAAGLTNTAAANVVTLNTGQGARFPALSGSAVTITIATPAVITWTGHGLIANQCVVFNSTGALPTGLTAGTPYYVVGSSITTNTFQVATAPNGTAIATSGSQSGTQTATKDWFYGTLVNSSNVLEVVKVTAVSGDSLTVVRAWDGTTLQTWNIGDRLELRITAAAYNDKLTIADAVTTYLGLSGGATTGPLTIGGAAVAASLNNTPIGGTTPSTGAFTTLSSTNLTSTGTTSLGPLTATSIDNTPIGSSVPASGHFSNFNNTSSTYALFNMTGAAVYQLVMQNSGANCSFWGASSTSSLLVTNSSNSAYTITVDQSGNVVAGANITAYSDRRLKESINLITGALDKVGRLNGVTFNRKDLEGKPRHAGVIAQEVAGELPEAVLETQDGYMAVSPLALNGLLIEAIKELRAEVKQLRKELGK